MQNYFTERLGFSRTLLKIRCLLEGYTATYRMPLCAIKVVAVAAYEDFSNSSINMWCLLKGCL